MTSVAAMAPATAVSSISPSSPSSPSARLSGCRVQGARPIRTTSSTVNGKGSAAGWGSTARRRARSGADQPPCLRWVLRSSQKKGLPIRAVRTPRGSSALV